jgi:hypothetical protein
MQRGPVGLLKIPVTRHTRQLTPRLTARTPVGPDVAPSGPVVIGTVLVGAALLRRVNGVPASSCVHAQGWRGTRGLWTGISDVFTGVAERLMHEGAEHDSCKILAHRLLRTPGGPQNPPGTVSNVVAWANTWAYYMIRHG